MTFLSQTLSAAAAVSRRFGRRKARLEEARIHAPLLTPGDITALIERAQALRRMRAHGREVFLRHPGDARSAFFGRGLDYEEARAYQPGDDIRDMDWRTTARTGKPYLKVFREEHHPALHILLDRSASMRFGTVRRLKVTQAAALAIVAAVLESEAHACVGGSLIDVEPVTLPCLPREVGVLALADAACRPCPPGGADGVTTRRAWQTALKHAAAALPRGARVLLLSDFHWLEPDTVPLLAHLAGLHDVAAVSVFDPAERELPHLGRVSMFDLSQGRASWVDTRDRAVRGRFAAAAARRGAAVHGLLARAGIDHFALSTLADPIGLFFGDASA